MPVGSAWSFTSDNEAFSRARFRGVTWAKLAANSQSFDVSRRRSVADVWFYRQCERSPVDPAGQPPGSGHDYCEDDPKPWVGNLFCSPRTTALHVQTMYIVKGGGMEDLELTQRIGLRTLKPNYWGDFPNPVGGPTEFARGLGDGAWQLNGEQSTRILNQEHEFHAHDRQRLALQALPFDIGIDLASNLRSHGWMGLLPNPELLQVNGDAHRLGLDRRDDLGEEIQIKIQKRYNWTHTGHLTQYSEAYFVGVKIHEVIEG
jgi:hypothetical protein